MRTLAVTVAVVALVVGPAGAQSSTPATGNAAGRAWSYSASLFSYFVPGEEGFAQPTLAADRGRLHVEARYNYEALETGSAWLGYTFSAGERWRLEVTPMLGGVFGGLRGIAPGYALTLAWSRLELDSEAEYFFDAEPGAENFFYIWSELSISPVDAWRAGIALQRTGAFETALDYQPGLLVGASLEQVHVTAYVFNLGWDDPTIVFAAEMSF